MKHISKIFAAVMAALTITSCSAAAVGAAEIKPCSQVKVVCVGGSCGSADKLLKKYCGENCNLKDIIKSVGGFCPDGNCSIRKPTAVKKQTAPAKSVEKPAETVAPTKTDAAFNTAYEAEVLRLVNAERINHGLSPLVQNNGVTEVARLRAKEIVKNFSHTRPDGSSCFTAAKELGVSYRSAGENIAYGYPTPEKVVDGWMNSEGHRKNILSASFGKIGIGCYKSGGVLYWTQFFTN